MRLTAVPDSGGMDALRCTEDDELVDRLARERIPLTVCPLSNVALRVFDRLEDHNLRELMDRGLEVSIHSDDPAYFGGTIGRNFEAVAESLGLGAEALVRLAESSFRAAFLPEARRQELIAQVRSAAASS